VAYRYGGVTLSLGIATYHHAHAPSSTDLVNRAVLTDSEASPA